MTGTELLDRATQTLPAVNDSAHAAPDDLARNIKQACRAWLLKSPSADTRSNYRRDLEQFLCFLGFAPDAVERLAAVRPEDVATWRDALASQGLTNSSIRRKLTVLRSVFSFMQTYGYVGKNPAHSDFVHAPSAPRDGKTPGLTPKDCRRLLDSPSEETPAGLRDRALLAVLAYSGCRVGELMRLRVGDYQDTGAHKVLHVRGKGGKERTVPIHPEAAERLKAWLDHAGIRGDLAAALFPASRTARGHGKRGFESAPLSRRAVQKLVKGYVQRLKFDPHVSVHSLRVTALTTAREQGSDIIDLQDFAGHSDPRTTLTYIRTRDRLSKSPAYTIRYA